jgi:hypothetical protein
VPLGKSVTATIMGSGNSHFYLAPSVVANGAYHFHRTEATTPTIDACAIGQCDFIGHIVVIVPTSQNGNGSYAYTTTSYKCQGDCGIGIIPH